MRHCLAPTAAAKFVVFFFVPIVGAAAQPSAVPRIVSSEYLFEAPPFRECHAATLVETKDHGLLAAWFAGTGEGNPDVSIWMARKDEKGGTKPRVVADGAMNGSRYACWNPVLARAADSSLLLFYKVGPSPRKWFGMMKTSRDGGETWSTPVTLPVGFLGPVRNKPVRRSNGDLLCPSSVETDNSWKIHMEVLTERTFTWKKIEVDTSSGYQVIQPTILHHGDRRLQILCRSRNNVVVESWSDDDGETWSPLKPTDLPNPNSALDAVALHGGMHLLVYNPTLRGADWSAGRNRLSVALSSNGRNWEDKLVLENESRGEFSYPAVIQTSDGFIHLVYTWNRKNIKHVVMKIFQ
ncbi:MAG TPA: sialidase family protein [Bacteroidota bacterium]|nr:sialidase family protein [Bacteroidota bacterium]